MRAQVRYEDVLALIDWKIYIHYVLKYNKTLKDLTDLKWRFLSLSKPTFLSILQLIWIKVWRTNRPCETFVWIDIWRAQKISETVIDLSKFFQRRVTNRMSEQLSWTLTSRLASMCPKQIDAEKHLCTNLRAAFLPSQLNLKQETHSGLICPNCCGTKASRWSTIFSKKTIIL